MRVAAFAAAAAATRPAAAAATAGTASTATTWTASTATARARRLRVGNLHDDASAIELTSVQLRNRVLGVLGCAHLDEAEAPGLAGEAIRDHGRGDHVPGLRKELPKS